METKQIDVAVGNAVRSTMEGDLIRTPINEVEPNLCIRDLKTQVHSILNVPEEDQKLLLNGKTLSDEHTIDFYPNIKDGTKLNLVVKKPESLQEAALKLFRKYYKEPDATNITIKFMDIVQRKFDALSLDDLERLAINSMNGEHLKNQQ